MTRNIDNIIDCDGRRKNDNPINARNSMKTSTEDAINNLNNIDVELGDTKYIVSKNKYNVTLANF